MKPRAVHYYVAEGIDDGEGFTSCGLKLKLEWLTTVDSDVTCKSCVPRPDTSQRRRESNIRARQSPGYADGSFPGSGKLVCYVCGRKIRDHPSWPCNLRVDSTR